MLKVPFGPFTVRPVKKLAVRRSLLPDTIDDVAAGGMPSVKAARKSIKMTKPRERMQLRIVDRTATT